MQHVVLLGDSIFDNGAYVGGGPDVVDQLRGLLPVGWLATLLGVDGALIGDVAAQLDGIPSGATHLVLSAGGNDALGQIDLLQRPATSVAEALDLLAGRAARFEEAYRWLIQQLRGRALPLTVCTIYNGNFPDALMARLARTALSVFNDVILRVAFEHELSVIDLRLVCSEASDYANPIEPSVMGGAKIAAAITRALLEPAELRRQSRVIAST